MTLSRSATSSRPVRRENRRRFRDCEQTIESDNSRWKRVIGDGLRSQTDGRQETEVAIAANVLNRMLELGRPEYVVRPNGAVHQWRKEPPRELSVGSGS